VQVAGKGAVLGLGKYLLPEAARRGKTGVDARSVLVGTLCLIAGAAVPMFLINAVAGEPLFGAEFGEDLTEASDALPWLGLAMTLLASAYLSVQYLLAMGRAAFIWVLGAAIVVEVVVLIGIGANLTAVALALLAIQIVCGASTITLALRQRLPAGEAYLPALAGAASDGVVPSARTETE
jgi:O-antigen/teichoic acid export membrane protein